MTAEGRGMVSHTLRNCASAGYERPVVRFASHCRVHLVDGLRSEGAVIPQTNPEFAGMLAAAIHLVRIALGGLAPEALRGGDPSRALDLCLVVDRDANWPIAQASLDILGAHLADTFGGSALKSPTEFDSSMLLHLRVCVPRHAAKALAPRLEFVIEALTHEMLGPEVPGTFIAAPAKERDGSAR